MGRSWRIAAVAGALGFCGACPLLVGDYQAAPDAGRRHDIGAGDTAADGGVRPRDDAAGGVDAGAPGKDAAGGGDAGSPANDAAGEDAALPRCDFDQDCAHLNDACRIGRCQSGTGLCMAEAVNEGEGCDDGLYCTVGETCSSGVCGGGWALACSAPNGACLEARCVEAQQDCVEEQVSDGRACDDGNPCTTDDRCAATGCEGTSYSCDDSDPCTSDICLGDGECGHPNNNADCDDGDPCTMDDRCAGGACQGKPLDADRDTYLPRSCGGTDCDDGDGEINPGVLEAPLATICSDGVDNDCDDLVDDSDPSCRRCTNSADCDDGNLCNGVEACVIDTCKPGAFLSCDDENPCTNDSCHPIAGCQHVNNEVACDDGEACTSGDFCRDGQCAGTEYSCASSACIESTCAGDGTCDRVAVDQSCSDDDSCTMNDWCLEGRCSGEPLDADGDGHSPVSCGGDDCDDTEAAVFSQPREGVRGATSCGDGLDNDCDGKVDGEDWDCAEQLSVGPAYAEFEDWNTWIAWYDRARAAYAQQSLRACVLDNMTGDFIADCIHTGALRHARLTSATSCDGLAIRDSLNAFTWVCVASAGGVDLYTTGLAPGVGLRHLVTATGFKDNALEVTSGALKLGRSQGTWGWGNKVEPLPIFGDHTARSLGTAGAIYVLDNSAWVSGFRLSRERISVVTLPGAVLGSDPEPPAAWCPNSSASAVQSLLCVSERDSMKPTAAWIEAEVEIDQRHIYPALVSYYAMALHVAWLRSKVGGLWLYEIRRPWLHDVQLTDVAGDAIRVNNSSFSGDPMLLERVAVLKATGFGAHIWGDTELRGVRLRDVRIEDTGERGLLISTKEVQIQGLTVLRSNGTGLRFIGDDSVLQGLRLERSGSSGHGLDLEGDRNRLEGVESHANAGDGVRLKGVGNSLVGARLSNNQGAGLQLIWGGGVETYLMDTVVVGLLATSNKVGVELDKSADHVLLSHATLARNSEAGLHLYGSDSGRFNNLLVVDGTVRVKIDDPTTPAPFATQHNWFHNLAAGGGTAAPNIDLLAAYGCFKGALFLDRAADNCTVRSCVGCTKPGLVNGTCTETGEEGSSTYGTASDCSDAVLHRELAVAAALRGLAASDSTNPHAAAGTLYGAITDWSHFDNVYRAWGKGSGDGPCTAGTCRIWDWRLRDDDTALRGAFGSFVATAACPASASGDEVLQFPPDDGGVFLAQAVERLGDGQGDDDGLCESDEACFFAPNPGIYQGDGSPSATTCAFTSGTVSNVDLYGVP